MAFRSKKMGSGPSVPADIAACSANIAVSQQQPVYYPDSVIQGYAEVTD